MNAVRFGEILGDHGTVKGHEVRGIAEPGKQGGDVAVAHENFGIAPDLFQVEFFEQVIAAVAATRADDGAHLLAFKHFLELPDAAAKVAGEVEFAIENRVKVQRLVAQLFERRAAGEQEVALNVAGGRKT